MADPAPSYDVLLVDDDRDIRETIAEILTDEGYRIETAVHGEAAFGLLRAGRRPRLILLDLVMPVMDGPRFLDLMRADPALGGLPVIVVSGGGNIADATRGRKVDGTLTKPVELEDLLRTVRSFTAR